MRIRQETVAVNFTELIQLERMAQRTLSTLQRFRPARDQEASIRFSWNTKKVTVTVTTYKEQSFELETLDGITTADLALLVSLKVENCLQAGDAFEVREVVGDADRRFFTIVLRRR